MAGKITQGIILIAFLMFAFNTNARDIKASGSDSLNFQTSGNSTRMSINSSGSIFFNLLTANRVPYIGASGELFTSAVTDTELGYLSGVTSAIQTQLDAKVDFTATNDNFLLRSDTVGADEIQEATGVSLSDTDEIAGLTTIEVEEQGSTPATPSAGNKKIYCKTDDKCYQLNSAGDETELGAGGAGDVSNLLTDGGFDQDATSGVDGLTCTVGTCTQETTNPFLGGGALKIALSSQAADVTKIYDNTNAQWDKQMVEVSAYVKSSLSGVEFCYWDGSVESNCVTYDGSNEWRKIKVIQQVTTENSIGWKVKSPSSTGDIFVDVSFAGALKVDGTTKVETQTAWYNTHAGYSSNNTKVPYFSNLTESTGDSCFTVTNDSSDGFLITMINDCVVSMSYSWNSNTTASIGILLNGSASDLDLSIADASLINKRLAQSVTSAANFSETVEFTKLLKAGDVVNPQNDGAAIGSAAAVNIVVHGTRHIQKSVLSDATAESTLTEWADYTPGTAGLGAVTITKAQYRRVGDSVQLNVKFTTGTVAPSEAQVDLPSGLLVATGLSNIKVGDLEVQEVSNSHKTVIATAGDSFVNFGRRDTGAGTPFTPGNGDSVFSSTTVYSFLATVPIEGWEAKPQIVGTFKPAVRASLYKMTVEPTIATGTNHKLNFDTIEYDPDGHVTNPSTDWKYVVPESGIYTIKSNILLTASSNWQAGEVAVLMVWVNGSVRKYLTRYEYPATPGAGVYTDTGRAVDIELAAGDEVEIYFNHNSGGNETPINAEQFNYVSITREDQAGRLTQEEPKKTSLKIQQSVNAGTGFLTDLDFSNLAIGKYYQVVFKLRTNNAASGLLQVTIEDESNNQYGECINSVTSSTWTGAIHCPVIFKASGNQLRFEVQANPHGVFGNGLRGSSTEATLIELNAVETNQW